MCAWPLPKKTHPKLPSPWKGDGPNGIIFHQPRFPWNKGDLHYNHHHLGWQLSWGRYNFDQVPSLFGFDVKKRYVPLSKLLIVGMVIPPFNKESLCWVYKPLLLGWWPSSFIHSFIDVRTVPRRSAETNHPLVYYRECSHIKDDLYVLKKSKISQRRTNSWIHHHITLHVACWNVLRLQL